MASYSFGSTARSQPKPWKLSYQFGYLMMSRTLGLIALAGLMIRSRDTSSNCSVRKRVQLLSPLAAMHRSHLQFEKKKSSRMISSKCRAVNSVMALTFSRSSGVL